VQRFEQQVRVGRLAVRLALAGGLDAMVEGVAHHVHQGVCQLFHNGPVQLDVIPGCFQLHPFSELAGQVADQAGHAAEQGTDGHQPHGHGGLLQFARDAGQLGQVALQPLILDGRQLRVMAHQRLGDHHLARHVHQVIQLAGVDFDRRGCVAAPGGAGRGCGGRRRVAGCRRRRMVTGLRGAVARSASAPPHSRSADTHKHGGRTGQ
jgi:hypothetical protein